MHTTLSGQDPLFNKNNFSIDMLLFKSQFFSSKF